MEFIDLNMREENKIKEILPKETVETKESKEKIELDIVLAKMKEDLEKKERDVVKTFEQEQEEKSIISYQELLKKNNKEDIIETLDMEIDLSETKVVECPETKKFRNSEFISPIYGRVNNETEYPKIELFEEHDIRKKEEIVKQITVEKIDHEIEKSEKFLKQLKDFRKNLE